MKNLTSVSVAFSIVIIVLGLIVLLGLTFFPREKLIGTGFPVQQISPFPGETGGGGGGGSPLIMKQGQQPSVPPNCQLQGDGFCKIQTTGPGSADCSGYNQPWSSYHPVTSNPRPSTGIYDQCNTGEDCCVPCGKDIDGGRRLDPNEDCDGTAAETDRIWPSGVDGCEDLPGFVSGPLDCYAYNQLNACRWDTTFCVPEGGPIEPPEYGCVITQSCSYTTILKATGDYNAHVNTVSASDASYPYEVCCRLGTSVFTPQTGTGQASGVIALTVPAYDQRHGGSYSAAGFNEYVSLNPSSGSINCGVVDAPGVNGIQACSNAFYDACMFTLTDDNDKTGHIADCSHSEYRYKICCNAG